MVILDLHLQLFVIAVCQVAADPPDELVVIERLRFAHGKASVGT
jgi:hypothetical protein